MLVLLFLLLPGLVLCLIHVYHAAPSYPVDGAVLVQARCRHLQRRVQLRRVAAALLRGCVYECKYSVNVSIV